MFHVKQRPDELAASVSRETLERLDLFAGMLTRWNSRINLVSARDLDQLWTRHIADSLQLVPDLPAGEAFVDLGSGGGFPGLILAMASNSPVNADSTPTPVPSASAATSAWGPIG